VLGDRDVGGVAEDLIEHVVGLALGRDDDLRAVGGVLVGDVGVGREDLPAVDGHLPAGRRLAPAPGTAARPRRTRCRCRDPLTAEDLAELDRVSTENQVQGDRYPEQMQRLIDR
jgi:hypothetical protein